MSRPATTMRPVRGLLLAEQEAQEGRLPRARRADEEDELALLDLGGHVAERDDVALVDLGDVLEADHGRGPGVPCGTAHAGSGQDSRIGVCSGALTRSASPPAARRHWRYASMNSSRSPSSTACDVAGLVAGALVLHQLVRLQRVGADLAAERDVALLARQRLELRRRAPGADARRGAPRGSASRAPCSASASARSGTTRRCRSAGA